MVNYYSADYIFPVTSTPIKNGVVAIDGDGVVTEIYTAIAAERLGLDIERMQGIIVPGFVNSHCHLELSHLRGRFKREQGLLNFIQQVIANREATTDEIVQAMQQADEEMYKNGIVAVGDISNQSVSKLVKKDSRLFYHTYIETLCFKPDDAKEVFRNAIEIKEKFGELSTSIVPHAPYSVCKELFRFIVHFCKTDQNPISIHNQETEEENKLYRYKTGEFISLYEKLGISLDFFRPQARNSLQSIAPLLPPEQRILLVHNIYTNLKDIYFLKRLDKDITWCFCPNANLYIGGRLPKVELFIREGFDITVGTDSLASNDALCILSELKTLHQHFPSLKFADTIAWATLNGARFLKIDDTIGSIEKGKKPGLNLITRTDGMELTAESEVQKLV